MTKKPSQSRTSKNVAAESQKQRDNLKSIRYLQITITIVVIVIGVIRFIYPAIIIDNVTIALLVIALVPWLYPLFKSVEIPGVGKVEFQNGLQDGKIEKVERELTKASLLDVKDPRGGGGYTTTLDVLANMKTDPPTVAFGIKTVIQQSLFIQTQEKCSDPTGQSIYELIRGLTSYEILTIQERDALINFIELLDEIAYNRMTIDHNTQDSILKLGKQVVTVLDEKNIPDFSNADA